jgi:exodeoxyribonuclease-5
MRQTTASSHGIVSCFAHADKRYHQTISFVLNIQKIMQLTSEQQTAVDKIYKNLRSKKDFILSGYAGTGKTTVISELISGLSNVAVCAPTGKAAQVLRSKGIHNASTIHSLIYEKVSDDPLEFRRRDTLSYSAIIIDEASMIDKDVLFDLQKYRRPILFVGDGFQLPPVGQDAKILSKPDYILETVHRTALDNPIIKLATWLRGEKRHWCYFFDKHKNCDKLTFKRRTASVKFNFQDYDQLIVGRNETRSRMNRKIRQRLGFEHPYPQPGERVICLRNNKKLGVYNGQQFTVKSSRAGQYTLLDDERQTVIVPIFEELFLGQPIDRCPWNCIPFDFSYAITCHKSQGSEWSSIFIQDEAFGTNPNQWRYTAVTRAKQTATIYVP